MIGLDIGSTTSRAMIARADIRRNAITGRMELAEPKLLYRSATVLTPFSDGKLNIEAINNYFDQWINDSRVDCEQLFSGGVIITGLAAEQENASVLARSVREKVHHAIVATADDPCMESWLAFMGNSVKLSRSLPQTPFINLDIGGGTTNPAWGIDGHVLALGSYYIGARHLQFEPGSYRLTGLSSHGQQLLNRLNLPLTIGDECTRAQIQRLISHYVLALEAIVQGDLLWFTTHAGRPLCQVALSPVPASNPVVTFSGGIGELLYQYMATGNLPNTTAFGDLGVDLCREITKSEILCANMASHVPEHLGRATLYGLALHSAELSGNTVFMPRPEQLPVNDLPIVARLPLDVAQDTLKQAIDLISKSTSGGCIRVLVHGKSYPAVCELKGFGERLASTIEQLNFPAHLPLLLLVPNDFGKVIGSYASRWGKLPVNLMVVDEMPDRDAGFVSLGKVKNFVMPVYFFGMH